MGTQKHLVSGIQHLSTWPKPKTRYAPVYAAVYLTQQYTFKCMRWKRKRSRLSTTTATNTIETRFHTTTIIIPDHRPPRLDATPPAIYFFYLHPAHFPHCCCSINMLLFCLFILFYWLLFWLATNPSIRNRS